MVSNPRTFWIVLLTAAGALGAAAATGPVLGLYAVLAVVTAGSLAHAGVLIRLALRIHRGRRSFGPCRGAGFLGMGALVTGAGAAATGIAALTGGTSAPGLIATGATLTAAPTFLLGLLLLPGTAPTMGARLRRVLDGLGIGVSLFACVWMLLLAGSGPAPLAVSLTCCVTVSVAVITGLRAVRHRPAALACSGGAAVSVLGLTGLTLVLLDHPETPWPTGPAFVVAGLALLAGPFLIVTGARRADDRPGQPHAADEHGTFAGYPLLVGPAVLGAGVAAYHFLTGGVFDLTTVALGLCAFAAMGARELLAARDIRRYAQTLVLREARFRTLVSGSTDVAVVLDDDLVVRWQSPAAARQFGLSDQDVLGRPLTDLLHPADATAAAAALQSALTGRAQVLLQARLRDGFGRWRETESTVSDQRAAPEVGGLVVHVRDVGDRVQLQRTLDEVTWTDDQTGLANRRKFVAAVTDARSAGGCGSVLVLELDRFESVADLHGPAVANAVLIEAARRLRSAIGRDDLPARLTAAAFAVLTDAPLVHAFALATRLATALAEPFHLPGHTVHLTADVGVADLAAAATAEEALRHADVARRRAQQLARGLPGGRVECYDKSFEAALVRRTEIEQQLPGVVRRGELDLVFQPVTDLALRQPVGAEALLRWRHPRLGPIPPAEFLPIAEDLGLAAEIGEWTLHRACRQLSRWRADGRELWMSVNASARQLADPGWLPLVATAIDTHCVPADALIVEVSEAALPDDGVAVEQLAGLRALGARTAIDHFGTGPTALAHLRRLPIDVLKIDRALFSEPAGHRGPATPIVDVVVSLAQRLGIDVIAAGLETESHVDVVRAAGCRLGQGFLLSRPDHAEHVEAFLERHRTRLL
ncbi:EAL domain-containing protein [Dactylosporangium sp. AC04546]|uniref:putative bifunctional diguanylate cyclase/phosphodiesterase n=1 Tax=Dactylosporangium sp. AC04546 TaxID=2862460 RepID=UPI001EDE4546|nr:EAL domain-containing protein [Dactylosporangium sp. AC04546]WVK85839.1 EAL domain-containing protein [Dactylosporangium sp. AC04546]